MQLEALKFVFDRSRGVDRARTLDEEEDDAFDAFFFLERLFLGTFASRVSIESSTEEGFPDVENVRRWRS